MTPFTITEIRPDSPDAFALLAELDAFLLSLPYPQESRHAFSVDKLIEQRVVFYVVYFNGVPAGCGGVKRFDTDFAEVKRMYVRPEYRGQGLARAILDRISDCARQMGVTLLRLETGIYQTDAIALYEGWGFHRRPPYGDYRVDPMSVYFEKEIDLK